MVQVIPFLCHIPGMPGRIGAVEHFLLMSKLSGKNNFQTFLNRVPTDCLIVGISTFP